MIPPYSVPPDDDDGLDDVWAAPIPNPKDPCNRKCGVNSATGVCGGCLRTLDEVADWDRMSNDEKVEVLKKIESRKATGMQERDPSLFIGRRGYTEPFARKIK